MEAYFKLGGYTLVAILLLVAAIMPYHFEAKAYNRLVQPPVKATAWDAFFVKLRVINCSATTKS